MRVSARVRKDSFEGKVSYRGRRAGILGMRQRGTIRQPARPFFDQAVSGWERDAITELGQAVDRVVNARVP